jgi:ribonuclease-3
MKELVNLSEVEKIIGYKFKTKKILQTALTHSSYSNEHRVESNERLEFLGDAVIESVTSDYLFIEFPDKNEGFLTQLRSKMVSRQSLNGVAKLLGLDDHVITNSSNISSQKHIYGDAFEAMMGAIYLDQGYNFVNRLLINNIFANYLKVTTLLEAETDFKSRLIEWCQKNHHTILFSTQHDATFSSSRPFFYSKVLIDGMEVGYGAGESKKEAEQRACYSVSQGFNDNDCTKLLDTLDDLDAQQASEQADVEPKSEDKKPRKATQRRSPRKKDAQPQAEQPAQQAAAQAQTEQPAETASQPKPVKRVRKPRPKREKDEKSA